MREKRRTRAAVESPQRLIQRNLDTSSWVKTGRATRQSRAFNLINRRDKLTLSILLVGLCFLAYWDALWGGAPRADQLLFLHDATQYTTWELFANAPDWNRVHARGDFVLYRPILYLLLALEYSLYGYNFFLWQLTAVTLHATAVILLFVALTRLVQPYFAAALAALFALNVVGAELVLWNHLTAYILFVCFALTASILAQNYVKGSGKRHLIGAAAFTCLAIFTYEGGLLLSFLLACVFAVAKRWRAMLLLLVGPLAYAALNTWNLARHGLHAESIAFEPKAVYYAFHLFATWAAGLVLPMFVELTAGSRTHFHGFTWNLSFGRALNLLAVLALLFPFLLVRWKVHGLRRLLYATPCVAFLISYSLMISIGRAVPRELSYALGANIYYAYIPVAVIILGVGFALRSVNCVSMPPWGQGAFVFGVLLLAALNGREVARLSHEFREYSSPRLALIASVASWAETRGDSRTFFFVGEECPYNDKLPWFSFYGRQFFSAPGYTPKFTDVLFPSFAHGLNVEKFGTVELLKCRVSEQGFTVHNLVAATDRERGVRLGGVALSRAWRTDEKDVLSRVDELEHHRACPLGCV